MRFLCVFLVFCSVLLGGCAQGRHETMKLGAYQVGLNVPEEWVRSQGGGAEWRMPSKGRPHFKVSTVEGDIYQPLEQNLKQLNSLLEKGETSVPADLCGELKKNAKKLMVALPSSADVEARWYLVELVKIHSEAARLGAGQKAEPEKLLKEITRWREGLDKARGSEQRQAAVLVHSANSFAKFELDALEVETVSVAEFPCTRVTVPGDEPRYFFFVHTDPEWLVFQFEDFLEGAVAKEMDAVVKSIRIGYEKAEVE